MARRRESLAGHTNEAGAAMVEFALILVFVLLPLVLGIINFGYVFGQQLSLNQAVREGARKAVVSSTATATDVQGFVVSATGGLIGDTSTILVASNTQNQPDPAVAIFTTDKDGNPTFPAAETCGTNPTFTKLGGQLQVKATYQAKWLLPTYIPLSPPRLGATAVFRCEAI